MSSYNDFAFVYDSLMADVNYKERTEYLLRLFKKYGKVPTLLLDLCCGTGGFSNLFAKKGIEVIGVDMSEDMLSVARENSAKFGADVLYLCQKAEELDLYGTVDGAICCLDSLNHITDIDTLKRAVARVSLFSEKDSLFIFDLNTPYKHRCVLGNNTFAFEENGVYCVWQNELLYERCETKISLDFFVEEDGVYTRGSEEFSERAYTMEEITEILEENGYKVLNIFDDMTENPLNEKSERAVIVAQKLC